MRKPCPSVPRSTRPWRCAPCRNWLNPPKIAERGAFGDGAFGDAVERPSEIPWGGTGETGKREENGNREERRKGSGISEPFLRVRLFRRSLRPAFELPRPSSSLEGQLLPTVRLTGGRGEAG